MRQTSDVIREAIAEAASALLAWLEQGWIQAKGDWNLHRARVEVSRDWYAPYWIVTFTIEHPPWFGDSITVEVEEPGYHRLEANIDHAHFAHENITCCHEKGRTPQGHWRYGFGNKG